ncbi:MAG: extracellular solute-binding protein [Clostridia bacterium]|nr:extracellular solute-binding protein [Clostridia bacterium]
MKKIVALLLSIMLLALAAAPALADTPYEVTIQFVGLHEENRNLANVEATLNEITLEKIGCTVKIVPLFIGKLSSTTSLGVAGDEKLDVVVAGLTSPMDTMVKNDLLLPLDDLLAEYGQDALKITEHVAAAQKINGETYAISGYPYAAMAAGFVYNKTMAAQLGIEMFDGMTMDDLTKVGEKLKENGIYLTTIGNQDQCMYKFFYGGDYFGKSTMGGILDPANSTTVVNVYDTQEMRDFWKLMKRWTDSGYMPADQLTDTTSVQEYFQQQHIFGTSSNYDPGQIANWLNPTRMNQPISGVSIIEIKTGSCGLRAV